MADLDQSWKSVLALHQIGFIESFLADDAAPYQRLIATVGTGKTTVAILITQELVLSKSAKKILYLLPNRMIAEQYKERFKQLGLKLPIENVDSRRFRELLTKTEINTSPWPNEGLVLLSIDTAKSSEVLKTIPLTEWDLIVSDSVHYQGHRRMVLESLLENRSGKKLLILEDPTQNLAKDKPEFSYAGIVTTRWTSRDFQFLYPKDIEFRLKVIDYLRSPEEIEFIRYYIKLNEQTGNTSFNQFFRLRLVSSSLYAAEQSLRQIRNKLVHQSALSFLDESEEAESESGTTEEKLYRFGQHDEIDLDPAQLLIGIQQLLDLLNLIPIDRKYETFIRYMMNECRGKNVMVLSSYAATISYLTSSLGEQRKDVYQLLGSTSSDQIHIMLSKFRSEGGILIGSTAALAGSDIGFDELIFYDTLNDPHLIRQVIYQLLARNPLHDLEETGMVKRIITLKDKSKIIPSEERRIQKLQRIVREFSK